jgi:hypothetical protein
MARVDSFRRQKGSSRACNPDDYYGYVDIEWTVCDQRGRSAPWLAKKLTDDDSSRIASEIIKHMED